MKLVLFIFVALYSIDLSCSMLATDEQGLFTTNIKASPVEAKDKITGPDELLRIMKDPDNIISEDFSIPNGLWDRVLFWAKIYSMYSSSVYVIHDKEDLSVVYKVVGLSNSRSSQANEKEKIKKIIKRAYKSKTLTSFSPKSQEETNIYTNIKTKMKGKKLDDIYSRIRVQDGQKNFIVDGIKVSSRYLPIIEDMFKEYGLPWELTRIPFVESSFNIRADSKVGARGIWQIMGKTGKKFIGVDSNYDERYSPFKASVVAAKLLKENQEILGTWPLAITAYNHGPGGLKQASKKLGTKDISKIVNNYRSNTFGFASQNFYSEFLAALYVTSYSDRLFGKIDKQPLMNFFYVEMESPMFVRDLAKISMLSDQDILKYNPELGKRILKGDMPIKKGSMIKLPPRASYRIEEYFERSLDKKKLEQELNIKGSN